MRQITIFLLYTLLSFPAAYAQQKTVTGLVRDNNGPLQGVSVIEKGMPQNGSTTDAAGRFRLTLQGTSNTVVFQSVGFAAQEFVVRDNREIEITLQSSVQSMNEVVVVAYG